MNSPIRVKKKLPVGLQQMTATPKTKRATRNKPLIGTNLTDNMIDYTDDEMAEAEQNYNSHVVMSAPKPPPPPMTTTPKASYHPPPALDFPS